MKFIVGAILLCRAVGAQPNWVQLSPSTVPPAREAGVMAYDGARHQIVMFGGAVTSGPNSFIEGDVSFDIQVNSPAAAVPEPSVRWLMLWGVLMCGAR